MFKIAFICIGAMLIPKPLILVLKHLAKPLHNKEKVGFKEKQELKEVFL